MYPIIITFDDGYESNYIYAYPILKKLKMKATISVVGITRGRTTGLRHFTWEQAREMYKSGVIDIQHHTFNLHQQGEGNYGKGVSPLEGEGQAEYEKRFIEDTIKLKEMIEEKVGNTVNVYTYPFGVYNEKTEEILKELGFRVTLSVKPGLANVRQLFLSNRINVPHDISSISIMKEILAYEGKSQNIPFEDIESQEERIKLLERKLAE